MLWYFSKLTSQGKTLYYPWHFPHETKHSMQLRKRTAEKSFPVDNAAVLRQGFVVCVCDVNHPEKRLFILHSVYFNEMEDFPELIFKCHAFCFLFVLFSVWPCETHLFNWNIKLCHLSSPNRFSRQQRFSSTNTPLAWSLTPTLWSYKDFWAVYLFIGSEIRPRSYTAFKRPTNLTDMMSWICK